MKIIEINNVPVIIRMIFVVSLAVILFTASLSYKHIINLNKSRDLVILSYEVQLNLERILSNIKDAETDYNQYLRFDDTLNFTVSRKNGLMVVQIFNSLQRQAKGNLSQQKKIKELHSLVTLYYGYFNKTSHGKQLDRAYNSKKSGQTMHKIRNKINEMVLLEKSVLQKRQFSLEDSLTYTPYYALQAVIITLIFLVIAFIKINRDFISLEHSNSKLGISQESINQSEIIGKYSSWQWNLELDNLRFSDNQFRLFGLKPQSFEATHDGFLPFVHADDRKETSISFSEIIKNENLPIIYYRIVKPNNDIRYLRSIGQLFVNRFNEKVIIGTTIDVTEEVIQKQILKEKNEELKRSNKELIEFNYAASHDLQEPLRKIQTFISRINQNEKQNMSEKGQQYVDRILVAATRMRVLIDDLLQYSRSNNVDIRFEKIDLNATAQLALQELSQMIDENKAKIKINVLPEIIGIPFQITQLFTNLINNAIKYRKLNEIPIIKISCTQVVAQNEEHIEDNSEKMYYKIIFADNGIGFDQNDSKKIFQLFKRLHAKDNYPGTGVGLTICKKIVTNHHGFICAFGELQKGAQLWVYLPTPQLPS